MHRSELGELEMMMWLSEDEVVSLISRPGTEESRPGIVRDNSMLDRFLVFARFREGAGEFR